jgi:hypothetical protein
MGKQTTEQQAMAEMLDTLARAEKAIQDATSTGGLEALSHTSRAGKLIEEALDAMTLRQLAVRGPVLVGEVLGISRQAVTKRFGTREEARTKIGIGRR